ncbi:hypothetical protein GCM10023170_040410 [Phytohabitans houttuyneae]
MRVLTLPPTPVVRQAPVTLPEVRPPADRVAGVSPAQSLVGNAAVVAGLNAVPPSGMRWAVPGADPVAAQGAVGNAAVAAGAAKPPVKEPVRATPKEPAPAAALGAAAPAVAEPAPKAKAKPEAGKRSGPAGDPKFQALRKDVGAKKRTVGTSHPPAKAEASNAQGAAVPPADDKEAQGKAANAEKMDAAQPRQFDKAAFVKAVKDAIAKRAPQNLDEADKFADSDKPAQVKAEVQGQVADGKQASAEQIATTTAAPPDTSKAVAKKVVPLTADRPPAKPGTPDPAGAVPDKLPASATDTSDGPERLDRQLADAQVTEPQLAKSNEPTFTKALDGKRGVEREAPQAQKRMLTHEGKTLAAAKAEAGGLGAAAMTSITGTRVSAGKQVGAGKGAAKGRDEDARARVTATLQRVFDATKKDVEDILSGLDKKVDGQFTREERAARDAFTDEHKRRMQEYKDRRYGGVLGKGRWVRDLFAGLPEEANQIYVTARDRYVSRMEGVISNIADTIGGELARAKRRIADGRRDLQTAVKQLPADLQAIGREAAEGFADKFDELRETVDDKGTELVDTLAEKYTEALKSVDDEIAAEKEKNKGLVDKVVAAVKGVIDTIIELKNLLLGVLRKAAQAVMAILKDPIGFLGNLVKGVGAGLKQFLRNIGKHLQAGILSWLLGVSAQAGIQLPAKFDARGILLLIASLLGLTWQFIRGRLTRRVPEQAVAAAETALPLAAKVKKQGIGGLWDDLRSSVGDLKKTLISKVVDYLVPTVIVAGITWVLSLLNPASAFIRACKLIIDIVRFVIERGRQIIEFVNAVLDAVIAIARGGGAGVPALVERALARSIPVLIGFLAAILGIGGIAGKVKQIFQTLSRPVAKAVDKIIDKLITLIKRLWAKLKSKVRPKKPRKPARPRKPSDRRRPKRPSRRDNTPEGQSRRLRAAVAAGVSAVNRYRGRPVAGKILQPLLAAIRIRYGLDTLRPVVRGDHWAVYGRINPELENGTGARAEGEEPTGANPHFAEDAKAFERKLSADAADDSRAKGAMRTMAAKAKAYIVESVGGGWDAWDAENARLATLLSKVAEANVHRSGSVGGKVSDLMAVFDRGTLTERFVHIIRFYSGILGSDLADRRMANEVRRRIATAQLNSDFLEARMADLRKIRFTGRSAKERTDAIREAMAPVPPDSDVRFQRDSRQRRPASESRDIGVTIEETGLRMSPREVGLHRSAQRQEFERAEREQPGQTDVQNDWDRYRDVLKWHAGTKEWTARNEHRWVAEMQELQLPVGAGPSGTTNAMMNAAQALGGELYATRLACIGFLVGARHHTLVEVLVAAEPFGAGMTRGQKMYRNVEPYSEAKLRTFGKNGKFPDEAPDAPGRGRS